MNKKAFILVLFTFSLFSTYVFSQQTASLREPAATFYRATELYNSGKYGAARNLFEWLLNTTRPVDKDIRMHTEYYSALCAAAIKQKDAEFLLDRFTLKYPESALKNGAYFKLAQVQFDSKNYRNALKSFADVEIKTLTNDELATYYYMSGYCHLRAEDYTKAQKQFANLRNTISKYSAAATYYHGYTLYMQQRYEQALSDFLAVRDEPEFKNQVPPYLIQIYYRQGNFSKVIEEGSQMLNRDKSRQTTEMARVIGDSHYRLGNFTEALPLLEFYNDNKRRTTTREESFQLGYLYYFNRNFEQAIRYFQPVTLQNDTLAQFAYYHIADCYLNTNHKQFAANAFMSAYKLEYDPGIREDALFNYARLASELSYNPYNEAIRAVNQYLNDFPQSKRRDEAVAYLVHLYLTTNNYKEALTSIESLSLRENRLKEAYQKIAFYRAIELFNDKDLQASVPLFRKAIENNVDNNIATLSLYWIGEAYYRLGQMDQAIDFYNRFIVQKDAGRLKEHALAQYSIGYAWFLKKDYARALDAFGRFVQGDTRDYQRMAGDALLRMGDCHFINKRYRDAIAHYDRALKTPNNESDYATLQKSRAQGALGNYREKITTLQAFRQGMRSSPLAPEALFEMGNTALLINQNTEALGHFNAIIKEYPGSLLVKTSLMKTALIYFNDNDNLMALELFKKVVSSYPGSPEAHEALNNIRNIYIELNNVDEYVRYSRGLSFAQVSDREQDSMTYIAAYNRFMANDCRSAISGFGNYLSRYPRGLYALQAYYYRAECNFRNNNVNEALADYESVISLPGSQFTETALLRAARINFARNNLIKALDQYLQLETMTTNPTNKVEALSVTMRLSLQLERYQQAIDIASRLLTQSRLPDNLIAEARLINGKALYQLQRAEQAMQSLREAIRLSPTGAFGAEAKYYSALILFEQKRYSDTENAIFELSKSYASYDYWVARGFILLADVYRQTGNIFQARQTLQSVIDNYQGDDLKNVARAKLRELPAGN